MKWIILTGLCFICAVSAQDQDMFSSICRYGVDTDRFGNIERCGMGERCPFTSRCEYILGSFGICCSKRPTTTRKCDFGEPLLGVDCGGIMGLSCPNERQYKCVTNPRIADDLGICCPRKPPQPQCKIGTPLKGVSCGGFRMTGHIPCPDPRYECVGEALAFDGYGICCLKPDPEPLRCPDGQRPTGESCGGWPFQQCSRPRLNECINNPALPDSVGICCRRQGTRY